MPQTEKRILDHKMPAQLRLWQDHKKVKVIKEKNSVAIVKDQPDSTPGLISELLVRRRTRYRISVEAKATDNASVYVANGFGRLGPTVLIGSEGGWYSVAFNSLDCTKVRLGILFGPKSKTQSRIDVYRIIIEQIGEAEESLSWIPKMEPLVERTVHQCLQNLLASREIKKYSQAVADIESAQFRLLFIYHTMALARYRGQVSGKYKIVLQLTKAPPMKHFLRDQLFLVAIDEAVRAHDVRNLLLLIYSDGQEMVGKMPISSAIGVCKLLIENDDLEECKNILSEIKKTKSAVDRFKMLEIEIKLSAAAVSWDPIADPTEGWREILLKFRNTRIKVCGGTLSSEELQAYSLLESISEDRAAFMNIRFSESEKSSMFAGIIKALRERIGLSLIRLGDGEAYAVDVSLRKMDAKLEAQDNALREKVWWGKTLNNDVRNKIKHDVHTALLCADILGLPSIYRLIRDVPYKTQEFKNFAVNRGVLSVLRFAVNEVSSNCLFTEDRCNQILFSRSNIQSLAREANSVMWISCWDNSKLNLGSSIPQEWITIPGHTRVRSFSSFRDGEEFCDNYTSILKNSLDRFRPGMLVLVSAGILGKIFIQKAAARGAVALDIGAMADYFAGVKTRSIGELI